MKFKNEDLKHIRFLIIFSIVYLFIEYGYPFLKNLIL